MLARAAALRHHHDPVVEAQAKFDVDIERGIEKALDIPVVQRLNPQDMWSRLESGDDEAAVLAQREPADQLAGAG